ncbi:MAG: hypothetical protein ACE5I9_06415, partial [Candidatus Methylomirabilales bacterium]
MHGRRLLSALILLLPFLLLVIYGGNEAFALLAIGVAGVSLWEFARLVDKHSGVLGVLALLGAVGLVGATYGGGGGGFALGAVLLLSLQLAGV